MKPFFVTYTHDKPAKFDYGDLKLTLNYGDQFQVVDFQGRRVIVKDGHRWPINPKLVNELMRRCEVSEPSKDYAKSVQQFDKFGHTFLKYVQLQAGKLTATDAKADSGFKNNTVYARFTDRSGNSEITCALVVTQNALHASIYSPERLMLSTVPVVEPLFRAIQRIGNRMAEKWSAQVTPFKQMTSHVANVGTPWGDKFSGSIYSLSAKWSFI